MKRSSISTKSLAETDPIIAGIPIENVVGSKVSVHNGCFSNDYELANAKDPDLAPKYGATGSTSTMLANRVSWFFDLRGPSFNIDSACSSSMIALDVACQGLRNGDSDMVGAHQVSLRTI